VRHAYDMLMRIFSHRYRLVDASGSPEGVNARIVELVRSI